jgi:septum formation protein
MQQLQGRVHQVYTGVTIAVTEGDAKRVVSFCDRTDVEFYAMTEEEINGYLALEKEGEAPVWSDKAGGYGIQTVFGTKFVKGIQGDYYNVMGLPASRVYHELKNLGVLE